MQNESANFNLQLIHFQDAMLRRRELPRLRGERQLEGERQKGAGIMLQKGKRCTARSVLSYESDGSEREYQQGRAALKDATKLRQL